MFCSLKSNETNSFIFSETLQWAPRLFSRSFSWTLKSPVAKKFRSGGIPPGIPAVTSAPKRGMKIDMAIFMGKLPSIDFNVFNVVPPQLQHMWITVTLFEDADPKGWRPAMNICQRPAETYENPIEIQQNDHKMPWTSHENSMKISSWSTGACHMPSGLRLRSHRSHRCGCWDRLWVMLECWGNLLRERCTSSDTSRII